MHLKKQLSEERACGSCTHFSLTPTSHVSACTGSALAHSVGPVAVQQRHVTLGGWGAGTLPPASLTILVHTSLADRADPLVFYPTPLNSWFALCRRARVEPALAGVAGATFLTFHFMRLALVTFGSNAWMGCLSLPPLAKLAIMPGVSNHFSVKIPTVLPPSPPPCLTCHPSLCPQHLC